jgi:hypothetical protein
MKQLLYTKFTSTFTAIQTLNCQNHIVKGLWMSNFTDELGSFSLIAIACVSGVVMSSDFADVPIPDCIWGGTLSHIALPSIPIG